MVVRYDKCQSDTDDGEVFSVESRLEIYTDDGISVSAYTDDRIYYCKSRVSINTDDRIYYCKSRVSINTLIEKRTFCIIGYLFRLKYN